jgi:hypothetical protein
MRVPTVLVAILMMVSLCGCAAFSTVAPKRPSVETVNIGSCAPLPCAKVTFATLPELPDSFTTEAKSSIYARVDEALYAPLEEGEDEISRDRFLSEVTAQYEEYLQVKDPGTVVDWQVSRTAFIVYANAHLVSVVVKSEGFLGGAHGFSEETLFVFDGTSGKKLSWDDVIEPTSRGIFEKAAEAEFRRARGIPPMQTVQEAGFTFENDVFTLPINFALTDKGIMCHYNPYEAAPYVMGATDFTVPIEAALPALQSDIMKAVAPALETKML